MSLLAAVTFRPKGHSKSSAKDISRRMIYDFILMLFSNKVHIVFDFRGQKFVENRESSHPAFTPPSARVTASEFLNEVW